MEPRWHILYGAIFTVLIWLVAPEISLFYLALIFLSSVLIDFDHYVASVMKAGTWRLKDSFEYHRILILKCQEDRKKGIRKKFDDFHPLHTVEVHLLMGLLGLFWTGFYFIFIGMVFHSLFDIYHLMSQNALYSREFFFFNWWKRKVK